MATAAEYATWIVQNKDKQGTPEFETVAEAYQIAKSSQNVATTEQRIAPKEADSGFMSQLIGAGETALTLGTAATGGLVGTIGGGLSEMLQQALAGKFGTPEAARAIEQRAATGAERYTYMPRTEAGMEQVQAIGKVAQALPPVLPGALPVGLLGGAIKQAMPIAEVSALRGLQAVSRGAQETAQAAQRGKTIVQEALGMGTPSSTSTGGRVSAGAAATPMELQRMTTAQGLPVPVELTKGAATREAGQLAFEKEQIKGPLGEPLRMRAEENSLQALANFDALIDMTGAQTTSVGPAATGNAVIDALSKGWQGAKAKTSAAYTKADNSPEALNPVDFSIPRTLKYGEQETTTTLFDYLNSKPTGVPSSAIPDTAKQYAIKLGIASKDENGNLVPLTSDVKTLEQLRKEINASTDYDIVNIRESKILKDLIDQTTKDVSGPLYSEARALREKQARKYEGRAVVSKLLTTVKGKDDPKIAASEAFQKSILNATPEEVTFLRRVLLTSGKDGQQAMKELQGATLKHLENEAKSGLQTDSMGRELISASKLNNAVTALDQDGRLDIILGKQKAQTVRDLNEVVKYVNTVPPGTLINSSGTAMTLMTLVGASTEAGLLGLLTGLPFPVLTTIRAATQQIKNNKTKARINEALNKVQPNSAP
jgi:hypothetical protein